METRKLKVRVTERSTKDGRKFNSYKTFSKNGRATELKFTKDVTELPVKDCYIVVNDSDVNLNTSGEFPICWVKHIVSIESIEEATAENNAKKLADYFG